MITLTPRASAPDAYLNIWSGVRCALTIFASKGTPNSSSSSIAGFIVSWSVLFSMFTPPGGLFFAKESVLCTTNDSTNNVQRATVQHETRKDLHDPQIH